MNFIFFLRPFRWGFQILVVECETSLFTYITKNIFTNPLISPSTDWPWVKYIKIVIAYGKACLSLKYLPKHFQPRVLRFLTPLLKEKEALCWVGTRGNKRTISVSILGIYTVHLSHTSQKSALNANSRPKDSVKTGWLYR